jgi:hypothetical protein
MTNEVKTVIQIITSNNESDAELVSAIVDR